MGRSPCCAKEGLNRGAWTAQEDKILTDYINTNGEGKWRNIPKAAGLKRCGKSCRLRWLNYLRPDIKRGNISSGEEDLIIRLHKLLGNRWSLIAGRLPGRTDNEIKNYWNTSLAKKAQVMKKQMAPQSKNEKRPDIKLTESSPESGAVKVTVSKYNVIPANNTPQTLIAKNGDINSYSRPAMIGSSSMIENITVESDASEGSLFFESANDQSLSDFSLDFSMEEILHQDFNQIGEFELRNLSNVTYQSEHGNDINARKSEPPSLHNEFHMVCGNMVDNLNVNDYVPVDQRYSDFHCLASFLGSSSAVEEWLVNDF